MMALALIFTSITIASIFFMTHGCYIGKSIIKKKAKNNP